MHDDDWNRFTTYVQAVDADYKACKTDAYERMLEAFDFRGSLPSLLDFVIHIARTLPVPERKADEKPEPCRIETRIADGSYRMRDASENESGMSGLPCPVCYSLTLTDKFVLTVAAGDVAVTGECYSCKRKPILVRAICSPVAPEPPTDDELPVVQEDELEL